MNYKSDIAGDTLYANELQIPYCWRKTWKDIDMETKLTGEQHNTIKAYAKKQTKAQP